MTKDEIASCVRKNVVTEVTKNMDIVIESVTELLVNLSTVNAVSSDTEARLKVPQRLSKSFTLMLLNKALMSLFIRSSIWVF